MDAPRPNTSTPATKQVIEYQWKLECGCTITHACRNKSSAEATDALAVKLAERSHQVLSHWFRVRQPRHQCALVSAENPNGISPMAKKSEDVPA